jgi:hypothetical protein
MKAVLSLLVLLTGSGAWATAAPKKVVCYDGGRVVFRNQHVYDYERWERHGRDVRWIFATSPEMKDGHYTHVVEVAGQCVSCVIE